MATLSVAVGAAPPATPPPDKPDHGINQSTFHLLWSHDRDYDTTNATQGNLTEVAALANTTDIPFPQPPDAVQTWNRQDITEFPATRDTDTSIYPSGTDTKTSGKGWISDAYVRVFAIQPSTKAYINETSQPLYVPQQGTILGTLDYRVTLPPDDTTGDHRVFWTLEAADIESVRAVSGARVIGSTSPGHVARVPYRNLSRGKHQVGLEATISIDVRKTVKQRYCTFYSCYWRSSTSTEQDAMTVRDTTPATTYTILTTGERTTYPDGDMGLIVRGNRPWAGLSLPGNETALGRWRFYSGRDTAWDRLVATSDSGTRRFVSPARPLQVYAYPSTTAPRMRTAASGVTIPDGRVLYTQGEKRTAPTLPASVSVAPVNGTYNGSNQLAIRHPRTDPTGVRVLGLVNGVEKPIQTQSYTTVETRGSNLSISFTNTTSKETTVQVKLTDTQGAPIATTSSEGYVQVEDQRVDTNASGMATIRISKPGAVVAAEYHPAPFWHRHPAYSSDRTTKTPPAAFGTPVADVLRLVVPLLVFWIPVYLFDKMFDADVWPPWRGL